MTLDFGLTPDSDRVGGAGWLDLDDLGTHIAEQSAGERPGDQGADLNHPDAVQGAGSRSHAAQSNPR